MAHPLAREDTLYMPLMPELDSAWCSALEVDLRRMRAGGEGGKVWMGGMLVGRQVCLHVALWRGRRESGGGVP